MGGRVESDGDNLGSHKDRRGGAQNHTNVQARREKEMCFYVHA